MFTSLEETSDDNEGKWKISGGGVSGDMGQYLKGSTHLKYSSLGLT